MPIEKRTNLFCGLTVTATQTVNEKGQVVPLMNVTLQTGSVLVDTETNNLIGSIETGPAYQVPANVVQEFFTAEMQTIIDGQMAKDRQHSQAVETAAQALKDSQAKATSDLTTLQEQHTAAIAAANQQRLDELKAASDTFNQAIKDRDATIAAMQQSLDALGGEPLAIQRKQEAEDKADLEQITALTRKLKAKDIDPVAVVTAEVAKAVSDDVAKVEA